MVQPRRCPRQQTLDKDEARRGREETTISLRKDKRAQQLQEHLCRDAVRVVPARNRREAGASTAYAVVIE